MGCRIRLLVFPTRAMDVLTAVITAEGEFTMTTPNTEEQALQAAPTPGTPASFGRRNSEGSDEGDRIAGTLGAGIPVGNNW
jgi:hypothetical protein